MHRIFVPVLLAHFALAALHAAAAGPESWVPARWPGGPLEVQRRAREGTLPDMPALRQTIEHWYEPATLDLLQGTPINCLLVTWSVGGEQEAERAQHRLVEAYAHAARARGITILGIVHGPAMPASFLQPAVDAGLDGLVLEGAFHDRQQLASELRQALEKKYPAAVVIAASTAEQLPAGSEIVALADAVPPGLHDPIEAEAGPSSEPWIDSNLWLVHSVRSRAGKRPVWLMQVLPEQASAADYLRAVADAAVAGGHWVITLGDALRHGLRTKKREALETWQQIGAFLTFGRERASWHGYPPLAVFGFVQDGNGTDPTRSHTNLKLAVRARVPLRVIERATLDPAMLRGLHAVHAIDVARPTPAERAMLTDFARQGGTVVVGRSWDDVAVPEHQAFTELSAGKGKFVLFREDADPGELARSLGDLVGRDRLGIRLFRGASVLIQVGHAEGRAVVQLLNYASYPAESVLVRLDGSYRQVRLHVPGRAPEDLPVDPSANRVEVTVPRLPIYGVLLFEP